MVVKAISTIIENNVGEITLISSPIFRMTSSISPRVFISVPSPAASRAGMPVHHDAGIEPPSLPIVATRMIEPQYIHISGPFTSPTLVRNP